MGLVFKQLFTQVELKHEKYPYHTEEDGVREVVTYFHLKGPYPSYAPRIVRRGWRI